MSWAAAEASSHLAPNGTASSSIWANADDLQLQHIARSAGRGGHDNVLHMLSTYAQSVQRQRTQHFLASSGAAQLFLKQGFRCPGLLQKLHHILPQTAQLAAAYRPMPIISSCNILPDPLGVEAMTTSYTCSQLTHRVCSASARNSSWQAQVQHNCSSSKDSDVLGCCRSFITSCPKRHSWQQHIGQCRSSPAATYCQIRWAWRP